MICQYRIAVVDDDPSVRRAICRLLRSFHFDAEAYECGRDFLDSLATCQPDCLILDMHMPNLSGLEVQRQLTRTGSEFPVIVITGRSDPETEGACVAAGAKAFLRKPINGDLLRSVIERVMPDMSRWQL